jgi:hypothetical protein
VLVQNSGMVAAFLALCVTLIAAGDVGLAASVHWLLR